jgi:hypothetical protein
MLFYSIRVRNLRKILSCVGTLFPKIFLPYSTNINTGGYRISETRYGTDQEAQKGR